MQLLLPGARRHARAPLSCALILVLGLLLGLTLAPARAATLTVSNTNDSGPGSLRAAIATANTDGGDDTIQFSLPTNIYPQITLSSTLTITAPMTISGPSAVVDYPIIDGGNSVRVFSISGGTTIEPVVLSNLVIADGNAPPIDSGALASGGGGIYNGRGDVLTLTDCILDENTAPGGDGGGLYNGVYGAVTLTGCTLSRNSAPGAFGGGLFNDYAGTATLTGCTLSGNSTTGGDGGGLCNGGTVTLTGCTLSGNSATGHDYNLTGYGGGLCDLEGPVTLTDCTIDSNSAPYGGGINMLGVYADYASPLNLTNCILTHNSATYGGALESSTTATLTDCTLTGNTASGTGGGISNGSGSLTLDNDILYGDTAPSNNEVDNNNGPLTVVYCDIGQSNPLTGSNGNIDADPHFVNAPSQVTLTAGSPCIGAGDPAQAGTKDITGVIRFHPPTIGANEGYSLVVTNTNASGTGSLSGVLLAARSAPDAVITFDPFIFQDFNTITPAATLELPQSVEIIGPDAGVAVSGGNSHAIFQVDSGVQAILTGLTVTNGNASGGDGGGLFNLGGALTLTGCTLSGNSAYFGGGLYNISGGTATLTDCTLSGNTASGDGGGIGTGGGGSNDGGDTVTLTDCTLSGNTAAIQGGAIEIGSGTATLTDCTLAGNSAHGGTGGGILIFAGTATVTDCTLTGNTASGTGVGLAGAGGAISNLAGTATLDNDILFGDTAPSNNEISGSVSATYCDIDQSGYTDTGDIRADPLFVGPPGNLQLLPNSPCIGQGDPAQAGTYDITGTLRPNPPSIGAYEGTPAATRTRIASSSNSSLYGQSVTFTATVANNSPGSSTFPTGSVEFYVNGVPAATVSLTNVGGVATAAYTTSSLEGGTDYVTASLMGNAQFTSSSSDPLRHDVRTADTSTGVTSFVNPSTVGADADFVATVANTSGTGAVPTGSVAFYINNSTTPFDTETLDQSGRAGALYTFTQPGTYTVTAKYLGDSDFSGSSGSLSPSQQVNLNTPTVRVSANPSPSVYGQSVTFSVTVFGSDSTLPTPTGTVTLQGLPGSPVVTLTDNGDGTSVGSYATSALPVGPNNYSAAYSGDANYANQTDTGYGATVGAASTSTGVSSSANPSTVAARSTFTATVTDTGANDTAAPTGTVTFTYTPQGAGSAVTDSGKALTAGATAGTAMANDSPNLPPGTYSVTATFVPDQSGDFSASQTPQALTQTVIASVTGVAVGWGTRSAPLTARSTDLPWLGINTLVVTLNGPAVLAPGDITLTGKAVTSYGPVTVSASGSVYTITLAKPITAPDRLTLAIGNAGVTSYSASFSVLPGDVNGDGAVNASDTVLARNAMTTGSVFADINGDGAVTITDYNLVRSLIGTTLP